MKGKEAGTMITTLVTFGADSAVCLGLSLALGTLAHLSDQLAARVRHYRKAHHAHS